MSLYGILKKSYHRLLPHSVRCFIFRITPEPLKSLKGHFVRSLESSATHNEIYDEDYYAETYIKFKQEKAGSCNKITQTIIETFHPGNVVDVGCGVGFLLSALKKEGITCRGLEYSEAAIKICHQNGLNVIKFDLEHDEFPEGLTADIVTSTEVAEHLPESCADRFVDILCMISKNVVMTAAQPGPISNISRDHVNEQPREYWINKFKSRGYEYNSKLTDKWSADWKADHVVPWYCENLMIFQKAGTP